MYSLNQAIYNRNSLIWFIEDSINLIVNNKRELAVTKEYWLLYFIKDDVHAIFTSLHNKDITYEFLEFPTIQRVTRHVIESYFDFINLCQDEEYIEVMKYCAHEKSNVSDQYLKFRWNNNFSIKSKGNIAKEKNGYNSDNIERLIEIASHSNSYVHPNVFLETIGPDNIEKKAEILQKLLDANLFMLTDTYVRFLDKYTNRCIPFLNCQVCNNPNKDCSECYKKVYDHCSGLVNSRYLISSSPNPAPQFMQP